MKQEQVFLRWLSSRTEDKEAKEFEKSQLPSPPEEELEKQAARDNAYDYDAAEEPYVPVGLNGLLASTEKLLAVNRGQEETDFRDSQIFKKNFEPDRQLWERIRVDKDGIRKGLLRSASGRRNLSGLVPFYFDKYTEKHITANSLVSPLEEINPIHLVESARRITHMGDGGIRSADSITEELQSVHPSQFGFIDPLAGPESERAGVDVRLSWKAKLGSDGRIYQVYRNKKTGKQEYKSPEDLDGLNVKLPD